MLLSIRGELDREHKAQITVAGHIATHGVFDNAGPLFSYVFPAKEQRISTNVANQRARVIAGKAVNELPFRLFVRNRRLRRLGGIYLYLILGSVN